MCGLSVIALDETHERDCLVGAGSSADPARKKELMLLWPLTSSGAIETEPAGRASGSAGAAQHRRGARTGCARGVTAV
jgi:hypothetical protein